MLRLSISVICFTILSPLFLYAQEEVGQQLWFDINPRWYSSGQLKIKGQFGIRQDFSQKQWTQYVAKPSVAYSLLEGLDIRAGLGVHYTDNIKEQPGSSTYDLAIIPFQGINYVQSLTENWKMNYTLRLEEKFDKNELTEESLNSLRLRFRLRTFYQFNAYQKGRYYRTTLGWEGFKTMSGQDGIISEKSRVTVGVERSFNHKQKVRLELTWQYQSLSLYSPDSVNSFSDIYLRLRYYPSWGTIFRNRLRDSD